MPSKNYCQVQMNLEIRGFLETSMIDWDGKISSVIFLPGCNFRCPFCHNFPLLFKPETLKKFEIEDIKKYLNEHRNWVDAVVISGGEPTLYKDLKKLMKEIKDLGFLIKLDTNGTNPEMIKELYDEKLVDLIAMDIKAPLNEKYEKLTGVKVDIKKIIQSINLIKSFDIDHEFRTTVVPGLLDINDIKKMSEQIKGVKKLVIQQFEPANSLDESLRDINPYTKEKLSEMVEAAKEFVPNTILRGA